MNIVNLTPHALNLMPGGPDGPTATIPPSGQVARCAVDRVQVDTVTVNGVSVPVNQTQYCNLDKCWYCSTTKEICDPVNNCPKVAGQQGRKKGDDEK